MYRDPDEIANWLAKTPQQTTDKFIQGAADLLFFSKAARVVPPLKQALKSQQDISMVPSSSMGQNAADNAMTRAVGDGPKTYRALKGSANHIVNHTADATAFSRPSMCSPSINNPQLCAITHDSGGMRDSRPVQEIQDVHANDTKPTLPPDGKSRAFDTADQASQTNDVDGPAIQLASGSGQIFLPPANAGQPRDVSREHPAIRNGSWRSMSTSIPPPPPTTNVENSVKELTVTQQLNPAVLRESPSRRAVSGSRSSSASAVTVPASVPDSSAKIADQPFPRQECKHKARPSQEDIEERHRKIVVVDDMKQEPKD